MSEINPEKGINVTSQKTHNGSHYDSSLQERLCLHLTFPSQHSENGSSEL